MAIEAKNLRDISTQLGRKESALRSCLYESLRNAVVANDVGKSLRVLYIGCGRGELLQDLKRLGHRPMGVDVEAECVEISSQYAPAKQGGFAELETLFPDSEFDVIVSSHVIEHVDDPLLCLRQTHRLNAARYVFAVPNVHRSIRLMRALISSERADHPTHVYGWGRPEFRALLERAGFEWIRWHCDRVTINPIPGRLGSGITRLISPLETGLLPRLMPGLSSSLIVECQPRREATCSSDQGSQR
jgi:SAM-dependent methyltransferase